MATVVFWEHHVFTFWFFCWALRLHLPGIEFGIPRASVPQIAADSPDGSGQTPLEEHLSRGHCPLPGYFLASFRAP